MVGPYPFDHYVFFFCSKKIEMLFHPTFICTAEMEHTIELESIGLNTETVWKEAPNLSTEKATSHAQTEKPEVN